MILDASALVAIALDEPDREVLIAKINAAETVAVGAPTLVEAGMVLSSRLGRDASDLLADMLAAADAVIVELGPAHWRTAISAWWRFGKSPHPAGLNFGDCLAYAVAAVAHEPLLAIGDDFPRTDLLLA